MSRKTMEEITDSDFEKYKEDAKEMEHLISIAKQNYDKIVQIRKQTK